MLDRVGGFMREVGLIVRGSHERFDGDGYPDGLAGEAIPFEARIIAACDAYNAMTTTRAVPRGERPRHGGRRTGPLRRHAVRPEGGRGAARRGRPARGTRHAPARGVKSLNGPDRPAHRGERVPPMRDVLRSRDRARHLRRRRLPEPLHVRRPADRAPLHGLPAAGVRDRDRRRAVRRGRAHPAGFGTVRLAREPLRPLRASRSSRPRRPRPGRLPVREQALLRLARHGAPDAIRAFDLRDRCAA